MEVIDKFPRSQCRYCKWAAGASLHPRAAQDVYEGHYRWHEQFREPQPEPEVVKEPNK